MRKINKIFCVGDIKTGTKSLAKALGILGFKNFHDVREYDAMAEKTGNLFPKEILDAYDAFCDWPFPGIYEELDRMYPGSKFILTTRDLNSWLKSVKAHIRRNKLSPNRQDYLNIFDKKKRTLSWNSHHKKVLDYFKNRPEDFLIMNIIAGEGWEKLCPFLGLPIPNQPFPHENLSSTAWIDYLNYIRWWIQPERFKKTILSVFIVFWLIANVTIPLVRTFDFRNGHYHYARFAWAMYSKPTLVYEVALFQLGPSKKPEAIPNIKRFAQKKFSPKFTKLDEDYNSEAEIKNYFVRLITHIAQSEPKSGYRYGVSLHWLNRLDPQEPVRWDYITSSETA